MRVLSVSVTAAGAAHAARLPFEHVRGDAADTVRARWHEVDAFVLFLATGAAVRLVAPLLADKTTDPAVVCVDESGRYAIALTGGHAGGANDLARQVAALLDAEPVVTTATDATGITALDVLPGCVTRGDVAGVTRSILDGHPPRVSNEVGWPLDLPSGDGPGHVLVTDRAVEPGTDEVVIHPPTLVLGIGASSRAPAAEVDELVARALVAHGLTRHSVAEVATIDLKAAEPGIVALGWPVRVFAAEALAEVDVPHGSEVVRGAVGTPSVSEAAALLAAGPGAELVVTKVKSATATVAVARRCRPRGVLALVGLGPGDVQHRTPAAAAAVRGADVVIGYGPYVDLCADLLTPSQEIIRSPIGDEVVRAKQALSEAGAGRRVALVCSGDAGVYAMASIALELAPAEAPDIEVEVVPGVTAALTAAAIVGAPLGHDHCAISLSDLLTPWELIERRVRAAAEGDLVVSLYNPRSRGRSWQLDAARSILLAHRPPTTPVAIVGDAGRPTQRVILTTLEALDPDTVDMVTIVLIGSSITRILGGRMVTPRGYLS